MAGRKQGWGRSGQRAGGRVKGLGQREGRESRRGGGSFSRLRGHTHPADSASPRLGAGSGLLPPLAFRASGRPQAPLATTHGHTARALSHRHRCHQPRTARAPSGRTEGLKGRSQRHGGRRAESPGLWSLGGQAVTGLAHTQSLQRGGGTRRVGFWEM